MLLLATFLLLIAPLLLALRVYLVLPSARRRRFHDRDDGTPASSSSPDPDSSLTYRKHPSATTSLGVFMGSGGHTAEMTALLASLDPARYTPRTYVYCHGDSLSLRAVADIELHSSPRGDALPGSYHVLPLPRARRVGEGKLSTAVSASKTLIQAAWSTFLYPLLTRPAEPWVDVLILNGPGTAVVLVMVAYLRRVLGLKYTRIIYVESFARVKSLSLSGKLLRPIVDTFVVQWPQAREAATSVKGGSDQVETRGITCRGWLV